MLGWESLAKGFMCGKWSRADSEDFFEVALDEDNGAVWREMQLRRAYCDGPHNFDRRDRALELAAQKGATLPEIALGLSTPCAHSALKNSSHCHNLPIHGSFAACHPSAGYVISQSASSFALVGTTSLKHWNDNVKAARIGSKVLTQKALSCPGAPYC